jgi:hypothetical protein
MFQPTLSIVVLDSLGTNQLKVNFFVIMLSTMLIKITTEDFHGRSQGKVRGHWKFANLLKKPKKTNVPLVAQYQDLRGYS